MTTNRKPFTYYQALIGRKVIVKTIGNGVNGTVVAYGYNIDSPSEDARLEIRLESGRIFDDILDIEIEVIGGPVIYEQPQGSYGTKP